MNDHHSPRQTLIPPSFVQPALVKERHREAEGPKGRRAQADCSGASCGSMSPGAWALLAAVPAKVSNGSGKGGFPEDDTGVAFRLPTCHVKGFAE